MVHGRGSDDEQCSLVVLPLTRESVSARLVISRICAICLALFMSGPFTANAAVFIPESSMPRGLKLLTSGLIFHNGQESANWFIYRPGKPTRLTIPAINVDSAVQQVGLTANGAMDVPSNVIDVGWYEFGRNPGDIGSAVIAGHFDGKKGERGVFTNLDKLKPGNKIFVEDEKGMTITFVVRESRKYDPAENAADVFSSSDGRAHLNLITCDGVWDEAQNSYSNRLIVFTDKEGENNQL